MAFGRKPAEPSRVYEYGCLTPIGGEAEAVEQMRRGVAFWNRLVEIDRRFLDAVDALVLAAGLEEPADEAMDEQAKKAAWAAYWKARNVICDEPENAARIDALRATKKAGIKAAQGESGLWWCNYDEVETRLRTAKRGKKGRLQFHRWSETIGKVTVRYQQGLPLAEAFGEDTRFQIEPLKGDRNRHGCATLRLRVGSDGRQPVWLVLPVVMHRPLPAGSMIRSVSAFREPLGQHFRWKVAITVRLPEGPVAGAGVAAPISGRPVAGIDIGWRLRPDGLRVAALADDQGAHHELVLDGRWLSEMRRLKKLESTQDLLFNAMRAGLAEWLRSAEVPAWLTEATATLPRWESIDRLVRLATRWRDQRFDGDAAIMEAFDFGADDDKRGLLGWRTKQLHLSEWEVNLRDQLLAHRLYKYRNFAADLARLYGEVRIETFDLRPVIRRKKAKRAKGVEQPEAVVEAKKELPALVRYYRTVVAPGTLRLAIRNACQREGVTVKEVPAKETTQRCSNCESLMDFDAARKLRHRCETCGIDWDQDLNAAKWILRGGVPKQDPPPDMPEDGEHSGSVECT